MAHLKKDTTIGGINVYDQLTKQDRETKSLTHGLNVIESDQSSPIKVEFYGNTLINLLGKDGNFENEKFRSDIIDNENSVYGNKSLSLGYSWNGRFDLNEYGLINERFYIVLVEAKTNSTRMRPRLDLAPTMDGVISTYGKAENTWHTIYAKFTYNEHSEKQGLFLLLEKEDGNNKAWFDGLRIYEIDEETYNKIGVSLTDEDVERMFPYVDSIQHVRNPYVKVEGENLLPPFTEWNLNDNATIIEPYKLRLVPKENNNYNNIRINVIPGTRYYFKIKNPNKGLIKILFYQGNTYLFSALNDNISNVDISFVVPNNADNLLIEFSNKNEDIGKEIIFENPILTLSPNSESFTPHTPSYLYAETVLAGNNDKKDILYYNESKNRWEKIKWWETDVVLDGRWNWEHRKNMNVGNNVKVVRFKYPLTNIPSITPDSKERGGNVTNYKGEILKVRYMADGLDEEAFNVQPDKYIYFAIPNENSGWTYEMTPTDDMVKAYFNGWKYTGDGTNHSWCAIGDESITETDINVTSTTLSPTMQDSTIQPYKLTYQLAEPEIEVVQVEGDLSINGTTQVEVGSGVIVREKANPVKSSVYPIYLINDINLKPSKLKHRVKQIVSVYKNNKEITNYIIQSINAYGSEKVSIREEDFDPNAIYEVTYIAEQPNFTCNPEEVKATYSNNIRSALDDTIAKLTDNITDTTILKRQMLDVIARLEAMEGTE